MSVVAQEIFESTQNMLLTEPISPSSSITKSPSPGFTSYSRDEYSESVPGDRVVANHIYNPLPMGYQHVSISFTLKQKVDIKLRKFLKIS